MIENHFGSVDDSSEITRDNKAAPGPSFHDDILGCGQSCCGERPERR